MSKIVNLRQARKDRARTEQKREATANAAKFGRSKSERRAEADKSGKDARHLDGHRREDE
jgi:hypothetical protein